MNFEGDGILVPNRTLQIGVLVFLRPRLLVLPVVVAATRLSSPPAPANIPAVH